MALIDPNRRRRGLRSAIAAAGALISLLPAHAAADKPEAKEQNYHLGGPTRLDDIAGTVSTENLELRQDSTLVRASKAAGTGVFNFDFGTGTWILTGEVHIEFDGGVLDAQMATVVLEGGLLKSAQVQPAPGQLQQPQKNPVHLEFKGALLDVQTATITFADSRIKTVQAQGAPAQFSHQLKNSTRRHGRSDKLDYESSTCLLRLIGDVRFSSGRSDLAAKEVQYNLCDGIAEFPYPSELTTTQPVKRVPAPSTPDRATAK